MLEKGDRGVCEGGEGRKTRGIYPEIASKFDGKSVFFDQKADFVGPKSGKSAKIFIDKYTGKNEIFAVCFFCFPAINREKSDKLAEFFSILHVFPLTLKITEAGRTETVQKSPNSYNHCNFPFFSR